jgi:hypothetical protein
MGGRGRPDSHFYPKTSVMTTLLVTQFFEIHTKMKDKLFEAQDR